MQDEKNKEGWLDEELARMEADTIGRKLDRLDKDPEISLHRVLRARDGLHTQANISGPENVPAKLLAILAILAITALEGNVLPPLCFPTSSTKGKPRDRESHVLNRLLVKLISRRVFEPCQPDDIHIIRSKCAPGSRTGI